MQAYKITIFLIYVFMAQRSSVKEVHLNYEILNLSQKPDFFRQKIMMFMNRHTKKPKKIRKKI